MCKSESYSSSVKKDTYSIHPSLKQEKNMVKPCVSLTKVWPTLTKQLEAEWILKINNKINNRKNSHSQRKVNLKGVFKTLGEWLELLEGHSPLLLPPGEQSTIKPLKNLCFPSPSLSMYPSLLSFIVFLYVFLCSCLSGRLPVCLSSTVK